ALGRLAFASRRQTQALDHARRMIELSDSDPRGYELRGWSLELTGDTQAARQAFAAAVQRGTHDFRCFFETALAEQNGSGGFSASDARRIANNYERAINFNPRFLPAFENLAGVVGMVPAGNVEDRRFLEAGRQLFPNDGMIQLGLAVIA